MVSESEYRDRVSKLEVKVDHQTDAIEALTKKVDEMHSLFLQAKGARWVVVGLASLGGFLAGKIGFLLPLSK